jgi:hypothetical protein
MHIALMVKGMELLSSDIPFYFLLKYQLGMCRWNVFHPGEKGRLEQKSENLVMSSVDMACPAERKHHGKNPACQHEQLNG